LVARPFSWFLQTFRPAIDLLDGIAERLVLALGVVAPHSHTLVRSTEELQVMIQQARDRGLIPEAEVKLIQSAIELGQIEAREIMVPRPDMHALPAEASLEETMRLFATTQRSRIPVYEGTLDHIVGFLHIKDVLWTVLDPARTALEVAPPSAFHLKSMLRDVLIVPETKPASELLLEFRTRRTGLAMVVDEFGSILGLVTLEDILEQMVGEIHDEFDVVEGPHVLPDGGVIFEGSMKVRDLESQYKIVLPDESGDSSYETVGGFILNRLGFLPRGGESFEAEGYRFTVMEMDRRRVARVKIRALGPRVTPRSPDAAGASSDALASAHGSPKPSPAALEPREK
jgi:CBS domain containing-hemolysin-like protein